MSTERHFQPVFGGVVTLVNVTDLDDKTVIGFCTKTKGTKIFSKSIEIKKKMATPFEKLSFPREVIFQIRWLNGKYNNYPKEVKSFKHLENCISFYESRGGKCIGVLDVETTKNKKADGDNQKNKDQ
jgi:hypothetical protein